MSLMPPGGASTSLRLVCPTRTRGPSPSTQLTEPESAPPGPGLCHPPLPVASRLPPGGRPPPSGPWDRAPCRSPAPRTSYTDGPSASAHRQFGGRDCRGDRPAHCRDFSDIPGLYRSMTCRLPPQRVSEKVAEPLPAGKAPSGLRPWLRLSVASLPCAPCGGRD